MKTPVSAYDYDLPEELIAQTPSDAREKSKLLVLNRNTGETKHKIFNEIIDYLNLGDLLVLNDTKVMPANLIGIKKGGTAKIEVLLLKQIKVGSWECLVKRGKRLKVGDKIIFADGKLEAEVMEIRTEGEQVLKFNKDNILELLNLYGEVPLPPYIRSNRSSRKLAERYQTVYAKQLGASAAPTAGLHFTGDLLEKLKEKGIQIEYITLHTGVGTFRPVRTEFIEDHNMHSEYFTISKETSNAILETKRKGGKVIAVGTTCVRALETCQAKPFEGETNLFILPGFKFNIVDGLITNFHFPQSTLLMLVAAFAGKENIFKAYKEAVGQRYRFFSFGDAMLIR